MTDERSGEDGDNFAKFLSAIRSPDVLPPATKPFSGSVSLRLAPDDGMYSGDDAHYYECGASALNVILAALQLAGVSAPGSILDFGAGAGRVTRWLRAAFPGAMIGACDLRDQDIEFCRTQFQAETWTSGTDIQALRAPRKYDLIWVGSVLTHLSAENARRLMDKLLSWTNPGGLVVLSTIGRAALVRCDNGGDEYIHPAAWEKIKDQYATIGFGYADYIDQAGYGLSLTRLSWLGSVVENLPAARLVLLSEGVWDALHDVVVVQNSESSELEDHLLGRERETSVLRARLAVLKSSTVWQFTRLLSAATRISRC